MDALPSVLDASQDKACAVLRAGWRPPYADGPSRDELAGMLAGHATQAVPVGAPP